MGGSRRASVVNDARRLIGIGEMVRWSVDVSTGKQLGGCVGCGNQYSHDKGTGGIVQLVERRECRSGSLQYHVEGGNWKWETRSPMVIAVSSRMRGEREMCDKAR